ncbi:hypothetical protein CYMTET_37073 [Cymbomonas tetramitiformis]|uniref:Uncharacterized protein n=1 Tax=Cymbomonas tetramitiformis TaxID=36881 RepID=A0AAE0CET6_9CHLO|nr:hypothetical protein CYMTET_37073 [Cymbomonas tetramitiformis]
MTGRSKVLAFRASSPKFGRARFEMACAKGHNGSHPWMTPRAKRAVHKHISPRTAQRLLDPRTGDLSGEMLRMSRTLRHLEDGRMYESRRGIGDPRTHTRMSRSLSRELEFYAELCKDRALCVRLAGRPCFLDHWDADERAALLVCFALNLTRRSEQLSSSALRPASVETHKLSEILEQGGAAALDGETHVVRASVFAYADGLLALGRPEWYA